MTAPSTPAGWYPDPTGKPGQMYWDGQQWLQDQTVDYASSLAPLPGTDTPVVQGQQPPGMYAYKNPLLYAIGGWFFPPVVLFLMGGSRTTCLWMVGLWVGFWLLIWVFFIGAIFMPVLYYWSVVACYREAVRQNRAHGFVS
jgi:hypothetical protein